MHSGLSYGIEYRVETIFERAGVDAGMSGMSQGQGSSYRPIEVAVISILQEFDHIDRFKHIQ